MSTQTGLETALLAGRPQHDASLLQCVFMPLDRLLKGYGQRTVT